MKEILAKPLIFKKYNLLIFFWLIPPRAIIEVDNETSEDKLLNLNISKKFLFLFVLNIGLKKIILHFCFSFILMSLRVCADPIRTNFFFRQYPLWRKLLLNEGIYAPSKSKFIATFILFDKHQIPTFNLMKSRSSL